MLHDIKSTKPRDTPVSAKDVPSALFFHENATRTPMSKILTAGMFTVLPVPCQQVMLHGIKLANQLFADEFHTSCQQSKLGSLRRFTAPSRQGVEDALSVEVQRNFELRSLKDGDDVSSLDARRARNLHRKYPDASVLGCAPFSPLPKTSSSRLGDGVNFEQVH